MPEKYQYPTQDEVNHFEGARVAMTDAMQAERILVLHVFTDGRKYPYKVSVNKSRSMGQSQHVFEHRADAIAFVQDNL